MKQNVRFHFQQGRFYGFPTCCIIWYCAFSWLPDWVFNPPVSIWRRLGVPDDLRQFVPCPYHYKRGLDLHLYSIENELSDILKEHIDIAGYIDIGTGIEKEMGVSKEIVQTAVSILKEKDYVVIVVKAEQSGSEKKTLVKLLASPGTTYKDLVIKMK